MSLKFKSNKFKEKERESASERLIDKTYEILYIQIHTLYTYTHTKTHDEDEDDDDEDNDSDDNDLWK